MIRNKGVLCLAAILSGVLVMASGAFSAEPSLEISGIITGPEPVAIVDGRMVQPGDDVAGARVEDINEEGIRFRLEDGTVIVRQIKNDVKALRRTSENRLEEEKNLPPAPDPDELAQEKAKEDFVKAHGYLTDAEKMAERRVLSAMDFQKIISLYDSAEWALAQGINRIQDPAVAENYKGVLAETKAKKEEIIQRKQQFEDQVQQGIGQKSLILGMTKTDVERSWGTPTGMNKGNFGNGVGEQWVYQAPKVKAKYVYFAEDIFVGARYAK